MCLKTGRPSYLQCVRKPTQRPGKPVSPAASQGEAEMGGEALNQTYSICHLHPASQAVCHSSPHSPCFPEIIKLQPDCSLNRGKWNLCVSTQLRSSLLTALKAWKQFPQVSAESLSHMHQAGDLLGQRTMHINVRHLKEGFSISSATSTDGRSFFWTGRKATIQYPADMWLGFSAFTVRKNVLACLYAVICNCSCQELLSLNCSIISCHLVMCLWHIHYTMLEIRHDYWHTHLH